MKVFMNAMVRLWDMRHIDAFCHFFPQGLFEKMSQTTGGTQDIGKRMQGVRTIHDLDARLKMMDEFDDYSEVLSLGLPPLEALAGPDLTPDLARVANDGLAELCAKYPDRFAAYVGALPMGQAGFLEHDETVRGIKMFAREVYPRLKDAFPDTAISGIPQSSASTRVVA